MKQFRTRWSACLNRCARRFARALPSVIVLPMLATSAAEAGPASRPSDLVASGNRALVAGDADTALREYDAAAQLRPTAPQIAFNQGLAQYRKGDYARASEEFSRALALGDASLESAAKYNLGNCAYQSAIQRADQPQEALTQLKSAVGYYRDAIAAEPAAEDARVNFELAQHLMRQIEKQQEQQQQPQQDQQSSGSQPSSRPQESKPSSQPESASQRSDDQKQQEQKDSQSGQENTQGEREQEQQNEGEQRDSQQEQQDQGDEKKKQKLQSDDDSEPQQDASSNQGEGRQARQMSKQEAERLLQLVRDKERQRREAKARRAKARMAPTEKDW